MRTQQQPRRPDRPARTDPDVRPEFSIGWAVLEWDTATSIIINGRGATPGGHVTLAFRHIPGQEVTVDCAGAPTVNEDGVFSDFWSQDFPLVYGDEADADADVFVMARDDDSGTLTVARIPQGGQHFVVVA